MKIARIMIDDLRSELPGIVQFCVRPRNYQYFIHLDTQSHIQWVNLGETEELLVLLLVGLTRAALRFFAVAISAALLFRHFVRLF